MTKTVIEINDLSKRYQLGKINSSTFLSDVKNTILKKDKNSDNADVYWALKNISFEVREGDVLGIIGKNGAGKSTLLKILSRITTPTSGNIKVRGRIASLLEVGTGFHPELSGRENIFLNGAILGMTKQEIRSKFDEIVEFSGVNSFLETPVKRYSSGMYVRLAFAVAAHLEPEILIVDEVLAVGDVEFQKKCLKKMQSVAGEGRTILFVSHNMAAIQNLCTKSILLKKGCLVDIGRTQEVIKGYLESNSEESKISILERKDRAGSGDVLITDIRILDYSSKRPIDIILAGEDVLVEISYKSEIGAGLLKNVNIGLSIFNKDEQFITVLNSQITSNAFQALPSEGKVYCHIPDFPLMSGGFSVAITLHVDNTFTDQVKNAIDIFVEAGDFYKTGKTDTLNRQGVYINQNWVEAC